MVGGSRAMPYECPVCHQRFRKMRGEAQHLAMKTDGDHSSWRLERGLPEACESKRDVSKATRRIMEILAG